MIEKLIKVQPRINEIAGMKFFWQIDMSPFQ